MASSARWMVLVTLMMVAVGLGNAHAKNTNTQGPRWLIVGSMGDRTFCGPVPQIATMTSVNPDQFDPSCSASKYHGKLVPVFIGPLMVAAVIGFGGIGVFAFVCCCRGSRGARTSGVLPYMSVNSAAGTSPQAQNMTWGVAVCVVVMFIGLGVGIAGSDQVHALTYKARELFLYNNSYYSDTLNAVVDALTNQQVPDSVYAPSIDNLSVYTANGRKAARVFAGLDALRSAFVYGTVALTAISSVGALVAMAMGWRRTRMVFAFIFIGCAVGVWINFMIPLVAANVIDDMCYTINGCHFCYADGGSDCGRWCNAPWFQTMSACPASAQNMFESVESYTASETTTVADGVCTALTTLCGTAGVTCERRPMDCTAGNLTANGLTALVCDTPSTCLTVDQYAAGSGPGAAAAADVVTAYSAFTGWADLHQQTTSLNCAADNAFIESTPLGTYNLFQVMLCPRVTPTVNPPQQSFSVNAAGFLVAGLVVPLLMLAFLLHKDHPQEADGIDEGTALLPGYQ